MNDDQRKAIEVVNLPNQDYFSITGDKILILQRDLAEMLRGDMFLPSLSQMNEPKESTYALGAPEKVDLEKVDNLTVLFAEEESGLRRWQVDQKQNLHLALFSHAQGELFIKRYNTIPKGKRQLKPQPSKSGVKPSKKEQAFLLTGVTPMDLLGQFGQNLSPGKYSVTVLIYDMATNTETFEIVNSKSPVEILNKNVHNLSFIRIYKSSTQSDKGLRIQQISGEKIRLFAHVDSDNAPLKKGEDSILLQASLALLKLDSEEPCIINMLIPVESEERLSLHWEVDIKQALKNIELNGDYQAYLFVGSTVSEATKLYF